MPKYAIFIFAILFYVYTLEYSVALSSEVQKPCMDLDGGLKEEAFLSPGWPIEELVASFGEDDTVVATGQVLTQEAPWRNVINMSQLQVLVLKGVSVNSDKIMFYCIFAKY